VFSTIHTNDAANAVTRLTDMGIEPFLIASSLVGVMAQRLVRRPCYECAKPVRPPEEQVVELGLDPQTFYRGGYHPPAVKGAIQLPPGTMLEPVGCRACLDLGYRGRTGIYEMLMINEAVRKLALAKADAVSIRNAATASGMVGLRLDGARKVIQGLTTAEEVMLITSEANE
jgi:general secretion pathway protein E